MTINLVDIARTVVEQYEESARRKHLEIQCSFPDEPLIVQADVFALDQVLDNLVSNAIKFSPKDKQLFITVQAAGKWGSV
ncbi:MAG: hypothetical protein WDN00_07340 [Limisphaerales bacterium]